MQKHGYKLCQLHFISRRVFLSAKLFYNSSVWANRKKPFMKEQLEMASSGICYLQFAQIQAEPQLQLTQVQFGLPHFTL
jgi:hypothetical protein